MGLYYYLVLTIAVTTHAGLYIKSAFVCTGEDVVSFLITFTRLLTSSYLFHLRFTLRVATITRMIVRWKGRGYSEDQKRIAYCVQLALLSNLIEDVHVKSKERTCKKMGCTILEMSSLRC